jgi:hypothetical protein
LCERGDVPRVRLILDVDLAPDVLAGNLERGDGSAHAFEGWLELVRELELALEAARTIAEPA